MRELERELKRGLYCWYPFEENAKIAVTTDSDIDPNEIYDYIISVRDIERAESPTELISFFLNHLSEHGHLFIATENRLAIRYFCGDHDTYTDRNFDSIEGYRAYTAIDRKYLNGRLYAKFEIEDLLKKSGVRNVRFYSVLPGLDMPQHIFAENFITGEDMINRYNPIYNSPDSIFLDEALVIDGLIKNNMLHQMANAYLIDVSKDGSFFEFDAVTTSMDRDRFRAMATVQKVGEYVKKQALYPEGKNSIQMLVDNTKKLQDRGIKTIELKKSEDGMSVTMPYIEGKLALRHFMEDNMEDKEGFIADIDSFVDCIRKSSQASKNKDVGELGPLYENCFIDMVPHNAFFKDGEYVFFDQEYLENDYPINIVIQRTINTIYDCSPALNEFVPKEFFENRYNLIDKEKAYTRAGAEYIRNLRHFPDLKDFQTNHFANEELGKNRARINFNEKKYNSLFHDLFGNIIGKKLFLFGSGKWSQKFVAQYFGVYKISGVIDNNSARWGKQIEGIEIISPEKFIVNNAEQTKVIVCASRYQPILRQLKNMGYDNVSLYNPNVENMDSYEAKNYLKQQGLEFDNYNSESYKKTDSIEKKYEIGYVAGVFDLFHIGHLNLIRRAKKMCNYLLVGVVSDAQATGKDRNTFISEGERLEIVRACKYVDEAFILPIQASDTKDVYGKYHFDVQFSGSDYEKNADWLKKRDWLRKHGSDLIFFPYTQSTSSTKLKSLIDSKTYNTSVH